MYEALQASILQGKVEEARGLTKNFLEMGKKPSDILNGGLIAGMDVVGRRFKCYEMYLPEVLQSAAAMKGAMELLKPLLSAADGISGGKIIMATIEGDVHDIGKNLVTMMLEGAGFQVVDLGVDVPVRKIVETRRAEGADLIGISALLTTTMLAIEDAIRVLRKEAAGSKVMIGGAPITQEFAAKVGADGFAPDALRAIPLAKQLLGR
jgi:5-methyltetrahydrofolate--homocysteine methyltransferase